MNTEPLLTYEKLTLKLRNPFRLSYGVDETRTAFWIRLAGDTGWGEGTIPSYYHIQEADMFAFWESVASREDPLPDAPEEIEAWIGTSGPAPARCAVDLALHDRLARRAGLPLSEFLGLPQPQPMPTSFTIAIAEPEEMADLARQAAAYPVLKIKLGSDDDKSRLAAVRAARPDVLLRVDANAGWTPQEALKRLQEFESLDLEMVEQPVPKEDIEGMGYVQAHTHLPVVADESVQTLRDVERLAEAGVQAINLKLMKVGGLAPGLRILKRARELGLKVMLGCMIETSLGTTAMAHLAGLADWVDLDAPLLISNDPFEGICYDEHANIFLPSRPGIGAVLRDGKA